MTTSGTIPIGELSRQTGCNIETIRYYERIGLLPLAARRGRYRSYGGGDVRRLAFVRRARELGFPIEAIRALLTLAEGGAQSCQQAHDLALGLSEIKLGHISGCPLLEALTDGTPAH